MSYAVVGLVAFVVSALTLFSGFGLGTLVMPAFAVFFPAPVAVAATAVVHLANNLFKLALVGRHADARVVARFALPAVPAAMAGASLLTAVAARPPLAVYELAGRTHEVTSVKLTIGALIVVFAVLDLIPRRATRRHLLVGGLLSGFFGGLSGHQGAFRSAFLIGAGLERDAFVGTNVVAAVLVDLARLVVYGIGFASLLHGPDARVVRLVAAATLAAFAGSVVGARVLRGMTIRAIRAVVAAMLIVVGLGLASGLV